MSGQDGAHNNSTTTERASVDPHVGKKGQSHCYHSRFSSINSKIGNTHVLLLFSISMQLTNVLKHYATSVDNNTDKWTKLAKCLINNLPSVTSQAIGNTAALQAEVVKAQQQVAELQAELKKREARCADLEDQLKGMVVRDEETRARCEALERENKVLRKELEELKSRSRPQVFTASPSSITQDRPSVRTTPVSPDPPPSLDEFGCLSEAELEAKIAALTQRGCVSVFRNAGILTMCPNRDPGLKLVSDQWFEIAGWLLPDTTLPGSIPDLVKLLRNKDILMKGGTDVKGSVELVQAAYDKNPGKLAPAIQLVPWEYTNLHIQGLTDLLIRLGVDKPPLVRAFAEGDNIAGPSGIQQVDQARSAFKPTRLFPEEPIGNAQGSPRLVDQEVPMNRQRSHIGAKGTQTGPQPAARPPGGVAGPSRAVQASPSSITPDRPSVRTIPASPNPPPSIDEYGRLSKVELEAKIAELTQRGCVSVFRNAGILTKYPNRDPGDDLVKAQLFEIAAWLLPDTRLPGSIIDLVKLLRNKGKMTDGGHNPKGMVQLVQAAYEKNPEELAPAIQRVPWEDTHCHREELTQLLIRLGVDEVREAYAQNIVFLERDLLQKANRLTGAAPVAPAI
ncbi:hypothetical protein QJQ45_025130 [Haematococcus lacustris]|nr:hypothetical protein QJQ45_025130 [Haematococcus lacustris]